MPITKRISEAIASGLKQLKPIIQQQQVRDVSEADTVTLVKDLLSEAFGYDKYTELTGEYAIRGTYCDLVVTIGDKPRVVIECKAVGIRLDDKHVKQAIDYAANEGVEWVILTNAVTWRLYGVVFGKPIDKVLMAEVNILDIDHRKVDEVEALYVFTKHALEKGALADELSRTKALSRHMLGALILHNDRVLNTIRRELKRIAGVNANIEELIGLLKTDVIKRDAMDGPEATQAAELVDKNEDNKLRRKSKSSQPPVSEADTDTTKD